MTHHPTPGDELVERAARIIDPHEFRFWQSMYEYSIRVGDSEEEALKCADWAHGKSCDEARAKATEILALRTRDEAARSSTTDVERLREALAPFAQAAANIPGHFAAHRNVKVSIALTNVELRELREDISRASFIVSMDGIDVADFRRAVEALQSKDHSHAG